MRNASKEIWMVAGEAAPLAQTGGLGEVMRALPNALAKRGHQLRRWLPAYRTVLSKGLEFEAEPLDVPMGSETIRVHLLTKTEESGVLTTLVDYPPYFDRDGIYGPPGKEYEDNAARYALFCRSVLEYAKRSENVPDVIHGHDWQAGLVPMYLKFAYDFPKKIHTVFSIHNLAYQGKFEAEDIKVLGLSESAQNEVFKIDGIEFYGGINFMKAGLAYSNQLLTVSPSYAKEILTKEFGGGLEGLLQYRSKDLHGVLNGADYDTWSPETDEHLPKTYSEANIEQGKASAKVALEKAMGLENSHSPILGMVGRLAKQKGLDVFLDAAEDILELGIRVCLLGDGEEEIVAALKKFAEEHSKQVGLKIGFDVPLSHLITAGSDMMMLPSRFEPCGLAQMYAMRYGTAPIVHRTGGLGDTVVDINQDPKHGTGFVFDKLTGEHFGVAVARAATRFRDSESWKKLQTQMMNQRFSWDRAAQIYEKYYA